MSTNFTGREPDLNPSAADAPLFAATPVWDRQGKKRGIGPRHTSRKPDAEARESVVAPEERSFAPREERSFAPNEFVSRPVARTSYPSELDPAPAAAAAVTTTPRPLTSDAASVGADAGVARPAISATRTASARRTGISPAMVGGAIGAVALLAGGAWVLTRPAGGAPELTPGEPASAAADAPPTLLTRQNILPPRAEAVTPSAPMAAPEAVTSVRRTEPAARARPAARATASTPPALPGAPQPYQALNPGATPAPVAVPEVAPNPAPVQATPAEPAASAPVASPPVIAPIEPVPAPANDTPPT